MLSYLTTALVLGRLCSAVAVAEPQPEVQKRAFTGPSDPARFTFYDTPSKGVICDGDTGPDGETLWYEDLVEPVVGRFNYKTLEIDEWQIPYSSNTIQPTNMFLGNLTGLQCVVRTGKDGNIYVGSGFRNEIVQVNPRTEPPTFQVFSPPGANILGNLQVFNDAWAADQGIFFSQTTANIVTLFRYDTHEFINYYDPTPLSGPLGMRTDAGNNLWYTNFMGGFISRIDNVTGEITQYHDCCPLPGGALPEVLRSSTENQKYLWANAFGGGGFIRIEPDAPDASKFTIFTNPTGTGTLPFENDNDYCGRVWYTSPDFDILVYFDPNASTEDGQTGWTTVTVPTPGGVPVAGNFEVIMHRGPGHYMWFSIGTLGKIGRYELDADCVGQPQ